MLAARLEGLSPGEGLAGRKHWPNVVLSLQHPPVYTLGRGANEAELLFRPGPASAVDAEAYRVERGGKITWHGPGQLVVYPLLDLTHFRRDLHWYVNTVEQVIIEALAVFGLEAHRARGYPGVWVGDRKVAQVGMNANKWYTSHGFAINVDPDMRYFNYMVPCGIADKAVTSVAALLRERAGATSSAGAANASATAEAASPSAPPVDCAAMLTAVQSAFAKHFGVADHASFESLAHLADGNVQTSSSSASTSTSAAGSAASSAALSGARSMTEGIRDAASILDLDVSDLRDAMGDTPLV